MKCLRLVFGVTVMAAVTILVLPGRKAKLIIQRTFGGER